MLISLIMWGHLWEFHLHVVVVALELTLKEVRVESLLRHLTKVRLHVQRLGGHSDLWVITEVVLSRVAADRHRCLVQVIRGNEAVLILLVKHTELLGCHHSLVVASCLLLKLQLVHVDLSGILLILVHLTTQKLTCDERARLPKWIHSLV